jgi:hypothetical protein
MESIPLVWCTPHAPDGDGKCRKCGFFTVDDGNPAEGVTQWSIFNRSGEMIIAFSEEQWRDVAWGSLDLPDDAYIHET